MMRLTATRLWSLGATAIIVGTGASLHISAVATRVAQREQIEEEVRSLRAQRPDPHITACLDQMRDATVRLRQQWITSDRVPELLDELARVLEAAGVQNQRLSIDAERRSASALTIPVHLGFTGSLREVHDVLQRLERGGRAIALRRLTIRRDERRRHDELLVAIAIDAILLVREDGHE